MPLACTLETGNFSRGISFAVSGCFGNRQFSRENRFCRRCALRKMAIFVRESTLLSADVSQTGNFRGRIASAVSGCFVNWQFSRENHFCRQRTFWKLAIFTGESLLLSAGTSETDKFRREISSAVSGRSVNRQFSWGINFAVSGCFVNRRFSRKNQLCRQRVLRKPAIFAGNRLCRQRTFRKQAIFMRNQLRSQRTFRKQAIFMGNQLRSQWMFRKQAIFARKSPLPSAGASRGIRRKCLAEAFFQAALIRRGLAFVAVCV